MSAKNAWGNVEATAYVEKLIAGAVESKPHPNFEKDEHRFGHTTKHNTSTCSVSRDPTARLAAISRGNSFPGHPPAKASGDTARIY